MSKHRLLVIEDDQDISGLICRVAEEADFNVRATHDFTDILSLYNKFLPHIIILDIIMPGMHEFEFLRFLERRRSAAHIVILSGCSPAYRKQAEDLGIAGGLFIEANISKPFRINELRAILGRISASLDAISETKRETV